MSTLRIPRKAKEALLPDPVMSVLLSDITLNFPPSKGSVYEDLIEAIVYQQISIKAAKSIFERFCAHFGGSVPVKEDLAYAEITEMRSLGLSNQKAQYVKNIATFFLERNLVHEQLERMDDQALIDLLTEIKGVGIWTAQMILIFSLVRPDIFPVKDYGIQTAMQELYSVGSSSPRAMTQEMEKIALAWKPYRTYGTLLLWGWKRKQMNL